MTARPDPPPNSARSALPAFVIGYSDSSFTNPHEVVLPDEPEDRRGRFTHMGAMFWGFETRRHRGHVVHPERAAIRFDHGAEHVLHIGLQAPARVDAIAISTRWFTGNQVRAVSVDLRLEDDWTTVLERVPLGPDAEHVLPVPATAARECRIRCHQEGGIARVNLFGTPLPAEPAPLDLLADARISHCTNAHYGRPEQAVAGARREQHMVGWESARTGFGEQAVFTLAAPACIDVLQVDTYLHRLNAPLTCHMFGLPSDGDDAPGDAGLEAALLHAPRWRLHFDDGHRVAPEDFQGYMLDARYLQEPVADPQRFDVRLALPERSPWRALVPFAPLGPDRLHRFPVDDRDTKFGHLLFLFYPNGGIHGLRVHGRRGGQPRPASS